MKKIFIIIIMLIVSDQLYPQDSQIYKTLVYKKYDLIVRPDGLKDYVGTLYVDGTYLKFIYESDAGMYPTIMAVKSSNTAVNLIIKGRWQLNDWNSNTKNKKTRYYLISLKLLSNDIQTNCTEIDRVNVNGYNVLDAVVNDDHVNIRNLPNINGKVIDKLYKGKAIQAIEISDSIEKINDFEDYWIKIKYNNIEGWIYGYYLDFSKNIKIIN